MSAVTHPLTLIDPVCGKPAYHAARMPQYNDPPIDAKNVEHLNGNPCEPMDPVICESCGRHFWLCEPLVIDPANYVPRSES